MIEENDRIMVCVSGGKDSATLLYLMRHLRQTLPISFEIVAVHVDQKQPGYNGAPLVAWLQELGVEYEIVEEDTYSGAGQDGSRQELLFCLQSSPSWYSVHQGFGTGLQ